MLCMGSWLICVYVAVGCGGFGAGSGDQSSLFFLSSGRLILHKCVCVGVYVMCGLVDVRVCVCVKECVYVCEREKGWI